MSDFTYDNKDFTAIRAATKNLQGSQVHGTLLSTIIGGFIVANAYRQRNQPNSLWNKRGPVAVTSAGILIACVNYTLLTWRPRSRLDYAASLINTKYSNIISRTLNYQK